MFHPTQQSPRRRRGRLHMAAVRPRCVPQDVMLVALRYYQRESSRTCVEALDGASNDVRAVPHDRSLRDVLWGALMRSTWGIQLAVPSGSGPRNTQAAPCRPWPSICERLGQDEKRYAHSPELLRSNSPPLGPMSAPVTIYMASGYGPVGENPARWTPPFGLLAMSPDPPHRTSLGIAPPCKRPPPPSPPSTPR